jgi:HEAT repeat protein/beta-lactamase regulating signal transducer with metallopeptidase domain
MTPWPPAVDIVVKVSLLLGAAALATRALNRSSAAARHLVWSFTIVGALAMPVAGGMLPRWTVPMLPAAADGSTVPDAVGPTFRSGVIESAGAFGSSDDARPDRLRQGYGGPPEASAKAEGRASSVGVIAALIWISGTLAVLGWIAIGTVRMRWTARRARTVTDAPWSALAQRLADSLALPGRVTFLRGGRAAMPMTWGLWKPRVLMPAAADEWPVGRQRVVLLHELAHVKRRDCLTQLLAQLACAVYWFNPLAWLAARRLRAERERACDDLVLAAGTRGSDYADHLIEVARSLRTTAFPTWSAVAMAHQSQLEGRLMAILDPALPRWSPTRTSSAVAAVFVAAFVLPLAAMQPVAAELAPPAKSSDSPDFVPGAARSGVQATSTPAPMPTPTPQRRPNPNPNPNPQPNPNPNPNPNPQPNPDPDPDVQIDALAEAVAQGIGRGVGRGSAVLAGSEGARKDADPRVVAALMEALKDVDKDVRRQAMETLSQLRAPAAREAFVQALKDEDAEMRSQAAHALGQTRDPKYVDALAGALRDSDPEVREQAAFALGQIRDPRAVDPLTAALKDANDDVRQQAVFALGQIRDRRAVDPLIAALKDEKADVREQAAFALGQLRDPRALDALMTALKDPDADVRQQAAFALGQIAR